ncbi:hypothetical protein AAFN88_08190 [Pelagibius sp. CAU 1746]|uniref:hypothetical protein n=1 Tax=Pelagibius sp. CAU 1746 TaxID=3140370 RepID=UPI00325B8B50
MRHLPYLIGLFMLLPFAVWLGLDLTILPGSTRNLDLPLVAALTAVCLPLLAWFFLVNLGFLANSMSGADEFARPRNTAVRLTIAALPWISLLGSLASVPILAAEGLAPALLALPPVVGALIFFAIRFGEKARTQDRHRLRAKAAAAPRNRGTGLKALGSSALRALYAVPVAGWLLKDAVHGRASAKAFLAFNCFLLLAAGIAVFGYPVLIVAALTLVPVIFAGLFVLTWA